MCREPLNLEGKRFGRLLVLGKVDPPEGKVGTGTYWKCVCDCGNMTIGAGNVINRGSKQSCGCLIKERKQNERLPPGIAGLKSLYGNYKWSAKDRGLPFKLSLKQFKDLTSSNCVYCGSPPQSVIFDKRQSKEAIENGKYHHNGIDRVNNDSGYILKNCVPCCKVCNRAKAVTPAPTFLAWITKVYEFQKATSFRFVYESKRLRHF